MRTDATDLSVLLGNWERSCERFKKEYERKYDQNALPPAWMIFETATFGVLSKYFSNIVYSDDKCTKETISNVFGFNKRSCEILSIWFKNLNNVRNICAHGSILFSAKITFELNPLKSKLEPWVTGWSAKNKLYPTICVTCYILVHVIHNKDIALEICNTLFRATSSQLDVMGVPQNWVEEPLFAFIFDN